MDNKASVVSLDRLLYTVFYERFDEIDDSPSDAELARLYPVSEKKAKKYARIAKRSAKKKEREDETPTRVSFRLCLRVFYVAIVLVALLVLSTTAERKQIYTKERLESMEPGVVYVLPGGSEIIKSREIVNEIRSLYDLAEYTGDSDILLPYGLGPGFTAVRADYADFTGFRTVRIKILKDDKECRVDIDIGKQWRNDFETVSIYGFDIHFSEYDDVYQAEFENAGSSYKVNAKTLIDLFVVLNSLEKTDENGENQGRVVFGTAAESEFNARLSQYDGVYQAEFTYAGSTYIVKSEKPLDLSDIISDLEKIR